ncbi:MAG: hypothetical protein UX10_C0028G0023 [Candidatus Magasanikbacteria bacterium GW2011_GWA2_45_39]|uniref:Uncharacterized protein n=1 Tax=Candidatus Magasanikbacteria bacterium GW2011_GWA2_45_39 TaxID=1619041 RepID=A0A0G1QD94_9BACT|nr:MAG: hypothetical protein UX10_C0028G0023 [Candidatus Magasanikbacteria bacterium GW2011_GWA2_45_39]
MKTIVTHLNPDQDAVFSVWLIKRFFPGWADADVKFVPAGETLNHLPPDENPDIIHVDTGLGKFDHHHTGDKAVCAASLVLQYIKQHRFIRRNSVDEQALDRIIAIVLEVDHAQERSWPDPTHDRYEFFLESILDGLKSLPAKEKGDAKSQAVISFGLTAFDGIYAIIKEKVAAESIIKTGVKFQSPWGQGIGLVTGNDTAHRLAERQGYATVAVKDPQKGNVRIYAHPQSKEADLTFAHREVARLDPNSDWFLHASKKMLLNGSRANPKMRPTKLTLEEIIKILSK